jgi:hypothetical protein
VANGWVQDRWYVERAQPNLGPAEALCPTTIRLQDISAVCLVGAVALAMQQPHGCGDLLIEGRSALDHLWHAMQEMPGLVGKPGAAGRMAPRGARIARIRDLTRWNDQPGRTRNEVLAVLDLAISRIIMTAMRQPAPAAG